MTAVRLPCLDTLRNRLDAFRIEIGDQENSRIPLSKGSGSENGFGSHAFSIPSSVYAAAIISPGLLSGAVKHNLISDLLFSAPATKNPK
jgi:hypothetical protein